MNVDLVHVQTRDGLRLDGFLRRPASSIQPRFSIDVAICFTASPATSTKQECSMKPQIVWWKAVALSCA